MAQYDKYGREVPDQTPVEMPIGFHRPTPLHELIKQIVRTQISAQAVEAGQESFEEADDFDVDDENEILLVSPYEMSEMQEEFRYVEPESIDKQKEKEENVGTVTTDRTKENVNVQQGGTGNNRDRSGESGETVSAGGSSSPRASGSGKGVSGGVA